jgi:decaprenylphospho-beta-D-ribofuranose 2-oxidase
MAREPVAQGTREFVELRGWGRSTRSTSCVIEVTSADSTSRMLRIAPARGVIARGLGRSYGDAAQNAGGLVLDTTRMNRFTIDRVAGSVVADAGTSLDALLRVLVPQGRFVPVTPGTRRITVGGAVAADVHGKDHHRVGSFGSQVTSLTLALPDGTVRNVDPARDPELFWATTGGMGLTGVIVEVTFPCPPIETSTVLVDTTTHPRVEAVMSAMVADDDAHDYSVAWVDMSGQGGGSRSVLTRGRFGRLGEIPDRQRADPLAYAATPRLGAPRWVPPGVLNRISARLFNELWYRKAPRDRRGEAQSIPAFFHPLDGIEGWNRLYGDRGFVQWQAVVPDGAADVIVDAVEALSRRRWPIVLAVLKRFGPSNPGPLSFPMQGWTLAVDVPAAIDGLVEVLDALDRRVAEAGGRIYLAKDGRLRPELLPTMYPRLGEWLEVRERVDPTGVLASDLGRRLGLC